MAESMPSAEELAVDGALAKGMTLDQIESNYPDLKSAVDKKRSEVGEEGKKSQKKRSRGSGPTYRATTTRPNLL